MLLIGKNLTIMDKETLIKLATPASITLLAISIIATPLITRADLNPLDAIKVIHMNSCS